jgi:hypothetical protein
VLAEIVKRCCSNHLSMSMLPLFAALRQMSSGLLYHITAPSQMIFCKHPDSATP